MHNIISQYKNKMVMNKSTKYSMIKPKIEREKFKFEKIKKNDIQRMHTSRFPA